MNHKRCRPKVQRAGCFCKAGKKLGYSALRGGSKLLVYYGRATTKGGAGARLRLAERAKESA